MYLNSNKNDKNRVNIKIILFFQIYHYVMEKLMLFNGHKRMGLLAIDEEISNLRRELIEREENKKQNKVKLDKKEA